MVDVVSQEVNRKHFGKDLCQFLSQFKLFSSRFFNLKSPLLSASVQDIHHQVLCGGS